MIQLIKDLNNFYNQLRQYYQYRPLIPITTPIITTKMPIPVIPTTRRVIPPSPLGPEFTFGMSQLKGEMNKMKSGVKYPTCKYFFFYKIVT